jgi:hypothetical protein
MEQDEREKGTPSPRQGAIWFVLSAIALYIAFLSTGYLWVESGPLSAFFLGHFPAIAGLPLMAGLAALIVLLFPQAYGKIEFKVVGVSFSGAAGPVVLWLFCFLVMAVALKLFW